MTVAEMRTLLGLADDVPDEEVVEAYAAFLAGQADATYVTPPKVSELKLRYPAFAAVDDATIAYWLGDAQRGVDETWSKGDFAPAMMALAAHNMATQGIGGGTGGGIPAGVTNFRSGSFSVSFSDQAAAASAKGGLGSTRYGQEYLALVARNRGGPRVATGARGIDCNAGFNGFAGPLPNWMVG